jgi:cbb3-type cytochrome oxidase subunit 1
MTSHELVLIGMLVGMFYSLQFLQIYPFAEMELLSPGRWRIVHTNLVTLGLIGNACLAALHGLVPRLTARPLSAPRHSWALLVGWQLITLTISVCAVLGHTKALPWNEMPAFLEPIMFLLLLGISLTLLPPILNTRDQQSIASWYLTIPLVAIAPAYAVGVLTRSPVTTGHAAIVGLDQLASFAIMPLGYAILYDLVPLLTRRVVWSLPLARFGWWLIVLSFPLYTISLALTQHRILSPQFAKTILATWSAATASTVITNVFATAHRADRDPATRLGLRWLLLGTALLGIASVSSVATSTSTLFGTAHASDWTVTTSHLVLFGVLGSWLFGIMTCSLPRLLGATDWYRRSWCHWHLWLTTIGLLVMVVSLAITGLEQHRLWVGLATWEQSLAAALPYWLIRTIAGFLIIAGQMLLICHIAMTVIHATKTSAHEPLPAPMPAPLSNARLVGGMLIALFALLTLGLLALRQQATQTPRTMKEVASDGVTHEFVDLAERFPTQFNRYFPDGPTATSFARALELGRKTYESEACWHCHTQRVDQVPHEQRRWGPPAQAQDYDTIIQAEAARATRRIGPDLSREAAKRSNDWHLAHFFKPVDVVPTSVMPAYPWFFDDAHYPNERGFAIITYMQWLGSWLPDDATTRSESNSIPQ